MSRQSNFTRSGSRRGGSLNRRDFLKLTALTGAGFALAACGQGAPAAPTATSATDSSAAGGAPSGTVNYWHHFTSDVEMQGLERVMASFKEKYPDINLVQENIPNADFMAKFTAAVQSGNRPHTTMVAAERTRDMVAMGGLVDLTEQVNSWDLKKYFPEQRWAAGTVDGKIYSVPAFMLVNWIYYRRDWFEEAGIDGPPKTWEELLEAAIKVTDPSKNRYGFGMRGGDGGQSYVVDIIEAFGSPIVDAQGKPAMDAAKATEAVRFYAELYTKHKVVPPSAPNDSYRQIMEAFKTDQTAMVWHHTGSLKEVRDVLGDKIMSAPVPAGPAARIARVAPFSNGIMSEENMEAAWAWLSHWGDTDVEIEFLEATGYFPPSTAVSEDPRVKDNPYYAAAIETLTFGQLPPQFPGAPGWMQQTVLPAFQNVLLGTLTPEQAVEEMMAGLEKAVS